MLTAVLRERKAVEPERRDFDAGRTLIASQAQLRAKALARARQAITALETQLTTW